MGTYTIAITGASGSIYGVRLLEYLLKKGHKVYLTITKEGSFIMKEEVGYDWRGSEEDVEKKIKEDLNMHGASLSFFDEENLSAPISSGSAKVEAMVVIPCSMKTLSGIAHGYANNLVERAADVMIKEDRPLILVPRETPLNSIHLRNMLTLSEIGAKIIPAMPAFYSHPEKISDLIDFMVGKVLDSLRIENSLFRRWKEK
ncbi:MAG: flavin prenyltransferase UbiX [Thermodesulfovibrionales bacterium]|nr:flavin prenyltransferase UbiX [Thermodesulfovibrionales bacterium]